MDGFSLRMNSCIRNTGHLHGGGSRAGGSRDANVDKAEFCEKLCR